MLNIMKNFKCINCGSEDFITTRTTIHYHSMTKESEDEFMAHDIVTDLDSETYCGACKERFNYSVNI